MVKAVSPSRTILLVGGGSGGHIYPNLAVAERLPSGFRGHLVISQRPLDTQIAGASGLDFTAIPAAPLSVRPRAGLAFLRQYRQGQAATLRLIRETNAVAMIATGGFVSGPAVSAARRAGLPVALMSLDAVPGRANRFAAKDATAVFGAFENHAGTRTLPRMQVIGFPLRRSAVAPASVTPQAARQHFGLDPDRKTLLVFAGSQGARTINEAMAVLYGEGRLLERRYSEGPLPGPLPGVGVGGWQVLHVTGPGETQTRVPKAFGRAIAFCDRMDLAWRAADAAVTRCGAGTVAEAWANAVPSVMLPYPFHKDEHQKHNASTLVAIGGTVVVKDLISGPQNAEQLAGVFESVFKDDAKRNAMRQAMRDHPPRDGAQRLADWVTQYIDG